MKAYDKFDQKLAMGAFACGLLDGVTMKLYGDRRRRQMPAIYRPAYEAGIARGKASAELEETTYRRELEAATVVHVAGMTVPAANYEHAGAVVHYVGSGRVTHCGLESFSAVTAESMEIVTCGECRDGYAHLERKAHNV